MDIEQIYQQFGLFTGLSPEALAPWLPLCDGAIRRITGLLREDALPEDLRITLAAAGEAYYQYSLCRSGGDAESVKIGDISVSSQTGGSGSGSAEALRDALLAGAAGLLHCGFAGLRQVEG